MVKKFRVRFQVQATVGSPEAILLNYLNSKSTPYLLKDMVMIALRSYWLPLAYRDNSAVTKSEKDKAIADCIYRVKLQQQQLQEMLRNFLFCHSGNAQLESQLSGTRAGQSKVDYEPEVTKKFLIRFQVQALEDSNEGILLTYLHSKDAPYPFNDMALNALKSYWLPLAYKDDSAAEPEEKKQAISDCIDRLQLQEQHLRQMLICVNVETLGDRTAVADDENAHQLLAVAQAQVGNELDDEVWDPYIEQQV